MHAEVERELDRLRHAMRDLNKNVQKLSGVNNGLVAFNDSFGTFLTAINLQKTCVEMPVSSPLPKHATVAVAPPANFNLSGVPAPAPTTLVSLPTVLPTSKIPVLKIASAFPPKPSADPPPLRPKKAKKQHAPPPAPVPPPRSYHWPKGVRSRIPPKYQSAPELAKLERVLFVLADSLRGMSIGELVKASNINVIQAKDILQTLMKLEQIKCKREKHGFLYCRS
ncbi:hypothetical protein H310_10447 [Aphanomyces invadans]|uniref:Outer kinetochore protein DAM1 n=1 Tax=Aphanomyces invadans TaxID=157072 RepID=A0A024TQI9_9STRA|nr:hypothetical protein H310_10447 [Aphanomyces invadans]ETV96274.1 hypothetical protein H310_10447 [Aphanomyces invadans]|eukprot:XP_008875066.1 hypothetical protein H310_10447 [Aphanomyces invadans]